MFRWTLPVVLLFACVPKPEPEPEDPDDPVDTTVVDSADPVDSIDTPDTVVAPSGLTGVVVDASGAPMPRVGVLACTAATCFTADADASGRFVFELDVPATIGLKTHEEPGQAAALVSVVLTDSPDLDVGELYVPDLPAGTAWTLRNPEPATYDAGDGLQLTVRTADLTPAFGTRLDTLAAARLPDDRVAAWPAIASERLLAVFALHPFAADSATPVGVQLALDLPDGAEVRFRSVSEIDGTLSEPALGVAQGGVIHTLDGQGLSHLSYLVISR